MLGEPSMGLSQPLSATWRSPRSLDRLHAIWQICSRARIDADERGKEMMPMPKTQRARRMIISLVAA